MLERILSSSKANIYISHEIILLNLETSSGIGSRQLAMGKCFM